MSALSFIPLSISASLCICFFMTVLFLFLFLFMFVSTWSSLLLDFHVTIFLSLWPSIYLSGWVGSPSHASLSLSLPSLTQSLHLSMYPGLWLSLTSWLGHGSPPHAASGPGSHGVSDWELLGWVGCVCVCHGLLSHVPTSSDAGTHSNLMKGHTHPLLFVQVRPLLVPANFCSSWFF